MAHVFEILPRGLYRIGNIMVADDLATQEASAADTVLIKLSQIIRVSHQRS